MLSEGLRATLESLGIGTWVIEAKDNEHPRMYLDETMRKMMAVPETLTPEEVYDAWLNNVSPHSVKAVQEYMDRLIAGGNAEVEYYWIHPLKGISLIRCNGARNNTYKDRIRVEGMHRDITLLSKVDQKEEFNSPARFSEIASSLSQSLDSIFYINLVDDSYYEFHTNNDFKNLGVQTTGKNFFEECKRNLPGVCHPDDLQKVLDVIEKNNLLANLKKDIIPVVEYRLVVHNQTTHYRIKVVFVPDDDSRLVFTVENIESEFQKRMKEQASKEMAQELINRFSESYQSVYLINPKTQKFRSLNSKKDINATYSLKRCYINTSALMSLL